MTRFSATYKGFIAEAERTDLRFAFDLESLAKIEPLLGFLYEDWWKVEFTGLERLPKDGPALIVGNSNGLMPWIPLMLTYALMKAKTPRRLHIVADLDWIEDMRVLTRLEELGFVPWSSANLKYLFSNGQIVAVFPEGLPAMTKTFSERYRLREFDWTRILPAVEESIKIFPLATLGLDEAVPTVANLDKLAKWLGLPAYPITPFMPFYPFPVNLLSSLPVSWRMHLLKPTIYDVEGNRDHIEDTAKQQSQFVEGDIQADLNRMLRTRTTRL